MKAKVGFYDAYKEIRNRARRYRPESVVYAAMRYLSKPTSSRLEDIKRAPWQTLLLVKWICQDKAASDKTGKNITQSELDDLRQRLWELPERIRLGTRESLPVQLFFRQLLHAQIGFQRHHSAGILREAALLAQQPVNHPLRTLFEARAGISVLDFADLAFATYAAVVDGKQRIDRRWFAPLQAVYQTSAIDAFISCVSRTYSQLVDFCRALPGAESKVASEFYEFPVLSRYPFLRTGSVLECWHPAVFYRGMEGFVHSVLSEEGQEYINRFSKLFEAHVVSEAKRLAVPFFDETSLRAVVPGGSKVPDGLLSFPGCNIFIEAKAGLFNESAMTVGHSKLFAHKTKSLQAAVMQGWSASMGIRSEGLAPRQALDADKDYLLIVTNKELSASGGRVLAQMYPPDTLDYPSLGVEQFMPLSNIYVLSIEDFERLVSGAATSGIDLPSFLDNCVEADRNPETAVHFFEQHLDGKRVPREFSRLVADALDATELRLKRAFSHQPMTSA